MLIVQDMMEYVVVVLGKYLQMSVAWDIFLGENENLAAKFEQFNAQFRKINEVFEEVTSKTFKPGEEVLMQRLFQKKRVDEGLAEVRAKPWAEPLGKVMMTT